MLQAWVSLLQQTKRDSCPRSTLPTGDCIRGGTEIAPQRADTIEKVDACATSTRVRYEEACICIEDNELQRERSELQKTLTSIAWRQALLMIRQSVYRDFMCSLKYFLARSSPQYLLFQKSSNTSSVERLTGS